MSESILIVFGGLPGAGKTALSRALARRIEAVYLRIDTIEQAILNSSIAPPSVEEAGYLVAYGLAEDNLRLGRTVVADSVNPIAWTRDAWRDVARRAEVPAVEIEVVCSDKGEHRRRVESRRTEDPGGRWPSWADVVARDYHPWNSARVMIDTARDGVDECLAKVLAALGQR